MAEEYYLRTGAVMLDGSRHFRSEEDKKNEREVAAIVSAAWGCKFFEYGALCAIDWYAIRDGRMTGLAELKSRPHAHNRFQTVWLNFRKWHALMLGSIGANVPAIYVVRFTDGIRWIPLWKIDASKHQIAGCFRIVKSHNDIEPVIDVPYEDFRQLPKDWRKPMEAEAS